VNTVQTRKITITCQCLFH